MLKLLRCFKNADQVSEDVPLNGYDAVMVGIIVGCRPVE